MEKTSVDISLFDKKIKIAVDEEIVPLAKELESLIMREWKAVKVEGISEEVVKNKVFIAVALELLAAKKEADKKIDFCLDFLQKINFSLEEKLSKEEVL
jgi:hypothetical protein